MLIVAAASLLACAPQVGGDARRVIGAEAAAVVVVPSIEGLRAQVVAFLAGIEGTSGLLELVEGRYGVDLSSADGVARAGLDPAASLVAFERDGGLVVAAGLGDDDRFMALVADRLRRGAGGRPVPGAEGAASPRLMDGPAQDPGAPRWRAAWGVTGDHVGIVTLTDGAGDPAALWRASAAGRGEYMAGEAAAAARARAGQGASVWLATGDVIPPAPEGLGLARGVVSGVLDGLQRLYGGVSVTADRLSLRLSLDDVGERDLPVSWVQPEGPSDVFAAIFPKTTTALLRLRANTAKVRRYPSLLRKRFLPDRIPGTRGMPLPGLDEALGFTDGDFAVALLGLDPAVTVQHLIDLRRRGVGYERAFHLAFAARLRDGRAARRTFEAIGAQLRTSGWAVAAVDGGGFDGWTFQRGPAAYSVLFKGDVIVFITGKGEVAPFLAVGEQRALPLSALAEGEPVAAGALGLTPATAGLLVGFTRVTRELAAKGVPPYFLKIVNDLRVIAATLDVTARRISCDLDVAL